jgi:hypothetical protein
MLNFFEEKCKESRKRRVVEFSNFDSGWTLTIYLTEVDAISKVGI